jgi:hypothetical protein
MPLRGESSSWLRKFDWRLVCFIFIEGLRFRAFKKCHGKSTKCTVSCRRSNLTSIRLKRFATHSRPVSFPRFPAMTFWQGCNRIRTGHPAKVNHPKTVNDSQFSTVFLVVFSHFRLAKAVRKQRPNFEYQRTFILPFNFRAVFCDHFHRWKWRPSDWVRSSEAKFTAVRACVFELRSWKAPNDACTDLFAQQLRWMSLLRL